MPRSSTARSGFPDGEAVAPRGGYLPQNFYRPDVWLIAADGSDARRDANGNGTARRRAPSRAGRNLSGRHDLMPRSTMNSDIVPGENARLRVSGDGRWITFIAPHAGS